MRTVPEAHADVGAYRADLTPPAAGAPGRRSLGPRAGMDRLRGELEAILDVTPSPVRVFDADGAIARLNAAAALDAPPPRTLRELWERDAPMRAVAGVATPVALADHPVSRALRGDTVCGETYVVHRGGAARIVELSAGPVRDAAGRACGAVLVERDATERARLAQALEDQFREAKALNARVLGEAEELERMVEARSRELLAMQEAHARERRLAAVGQLAAGVMHDVNNALNPIIAAAYLLHRHADDPDRVRDYADRIAKAAETGAASASRVGRFLRQEPAANAATLQAAVDLATLADEVLAMAGATWTDGRRGAAIALRRQYEVRATTCGIAGEIREALLNLVQNAVDAMPGGGSLTVTTGVGGADGSESWVAVSDTGCGMTDEVRDRAFEPFFTTKGSAGSGLGLAEVYGIMRRHRGRAEIVSALGAGTTVRLVFPHAASGDAPLARAAAPAARGCAVLVVEDDVDGREFLHALLASEGHAVDTAAGLLDARVRLGLVDADAAAAADATAGQAPYDVLLTDVGLADGDGWDLVREARARWPRLRIGVVTGWEVSAGQGADRTLRKPLRAEELLTFVAGCDPEEG